MSKILTPALIRGERSAQLWDPVRATLAALLFGFTTNLQNLLTVLKTPIPGEFMLMLPYLVTIIAVAGFAGQVRGPAAAGKPYIKS